MAHHSSGYYNKMKVYHFSHMFNAIEIIKNRDTDYPKDYYTDASADNLHTAAYGNRKDFLWGFRYDLCVS